MTLYYTRTRIEDISLLQLLERDLKSFSHVVNEVMSNIEENYATELDRLHRIKEILQRRIRRQSTKIKEINRRLNVLISRRKTMHHYEGASQDRDNIQLDIEEVKRELNEAKLLLSKEKKKLKKCKKLKIKLSAQRKNQYLFYGKKPMKRLVDFEIPRACSTLSKIHELMIDYLSYSSPIIKAEFSSNKIKNYLVKQQEKNKNRITEEEEASKINKGREIFKNVEVKRSNGVKWMRVGFKKPLLNFNTQTLASLEKEATEKRCHFLVFRVFDEHKNFFKDQGYQVVLNPLLLVRWKGAIAYKAMFPDVIIDDPEILFKED